MQNSQQNELNEQEDDSGFTMHYEDEIANVQPEQQEGCSQSFFYTLIGLTILSGVVTGMGGFYFLWMYMQMTAYKSLIFVGMLFLFSLSVVSFIASNKLYKHL